MRLSRDVWWVIVLLAILALVAVPSSRAQEPTIEELALRAHIQNMRSHSYTAWTGGPLGDPALAPPSTMVGQTLDRWGVAGMAGDERLRGSDLTRPVLLNFWASWCYPCQLEFPHLVEVALAPDDYAFDVVFVNVWDTEADALAYLEDFPADIHTTLDTGDRLATRSNIFSIPTSLLVDTDGTVLAENIGILTPTLTDFLDAVAANPGEGQFVASDHLDEPLEAILLPVDVESATPIQMDETAAGLLTDEEFQHAYRYEGTAGEEITINLQADGSEVDPYVVLMAADGTRIAENDDISPGVIQDSTLTVTLPEDGPYIIVATRFLEAEGLTEGAYRLSVVPAVALNAPPETPPQQSGTSGTIAYGEAVTGTLSDEHYEDRWQFEGQQGDVISLVMVRTVDEMGGLDGYLILQGPGGATLIEADDSGDSVMPALEQYELPADGTYTAVATRFGFANGFSAGDYTLSLEKQGAVSTTAIGEQPGGGAYGIRWLSPGTLPSGLRWIDYNDPVSGTLTAEDADGWYIFRGREGDVLTIRMSASAGDLDPFLILTDANGIELARNDDADDSTDAVIADWALPVTDTYLIRATRYGFENGPSRGDYTLVIETEAESLGLAEAAEPIAMLDYRQPITGSLSLDKSRDRYTFGSPAGAWITISVRRTSGDPDLALALYDEAGNEIAANREWFGPAESRIIRVQLPEKGLYAIDVILEDLTTSGEYELIVLPAPSGEVDPGAFVPAEGLDMELVLIWSSAADLDLGASDLTIGIEGRKTASANDFCTAVTETPVERLAWESGTAEPRMYQVFVTYQHNCDGQAEPVQFVLAVAVNGEVVDFISGALAREGDVYTTLVDYTR